MGFGFSRHEFSCKAPMALNEFNTHLAQGFGHRAINWNLKSLNGSANMSMRLIQISSDTVSPSASLLLNGGSAERLEIPLRALTFERKWLKSLRGTKAVRLLAPEKQLILWINESYHLFSVDADQLPNASGDDVFDRSLKSGADIFSNDRIAFIINRDQSYLTICPRLQDGKVLLSGRQMSREIIRFTDDIRIRNFFSCERMLLRR
jgi:hypothetical protein